MFCNKAIDLFSETPLIEKREGRWRSKVVDLFIYEPSRLWRMEGTKHEETGYYKVAVDFDMLENPSTILEAAQEPPYGNVNA